MDHPTIGAQRLLGIPFTLHATPTTVRRPPPTLGQPTEEILRTLTQVDLRLRAADRMEI